MFLKDQKLSKGYKTYDTKHSQWGITFALLIQSKANKLEETEQFVPKPSETHIHEYPFLLNKQTPISITRRFLKTLVGETDLNTLTGNDHHANMTCKTAEICQKSSQDFSGQDLHRNTH